MKEIQLGKGHRRVRPWRKFGERFGNVKPGSGFSSSSPEDEWTEMKLRERMSHPSHPEKGNPSSG
jgi:hypothetical protein